MIGIDIVHLNRLRLTDSFLSKVLTDEEKKEYREKKTDKKRREYLGGRFAAKEAIFKATQDPKYLSYAVLYDEDKRPYVKDHPEIEVSISHDGDYAVAIAEVKR